MKSSNTWLLNNEFNAEWSRPHIDSPVIAGIPEGSDRNFYSPRHQYNKCKPNDRQNNTQCVFYVYPFMKSIKSISSAELF